VDLFYSPVTAFPLTGVPRRIVTVHDLSWSSVPWSYSALERFKQRRWTSLAARVADRVVSVSESTRRDLIRLHPAAEPRTVVIPPGVEERFFLEVSRREEERIRSRYGLEGRYLLTLAAFHPRKNLPNLVEAYDRFRERGLERIRLVIAGRGGKDSGRLLARIARSPFQADILLAGHIHKAHTGHSAERYKIPGHSALVVQAGTATSTRVRGEANGFNALHVMPDEITIERYEWKAEARDFTVRDTQRYVHAADGWHRPREP